MKLQKVFEDQIRRKIEPRKAIFFSRVKLWINKETTDQWVENCRGLLILYTLNNSYYFTIMNIMRFQICFDMEIYTNFLSYTKFIGQTKSMLFLMPLRQKIVRFLFILENKQELTELKANLQSILYQKEVIEELSFFDKPQVKQILQNTEITPNIIQYNLSFRQQLQIEIDKYFSEVEHLQKKKNNTGFKAYGFGREQWKLANQEIEFTKMKKKDELVDRLTKLHRQAKLS